MNVGVFKDLLEIIVFFIAAIIALRINWKFVPVILLDVSSEWIDKERGQLKLKIRIENKSNVKAVKEAALLQLLTYDANKLVSLSEWVPLSKGKIKPGEEPESWSEPFQIMETTTVFYPGEATSIDIMCYCPKDKLLHILLQFQSKKDYLKKFWNHHESWATTRIVCNNG